MFALMLAIAAVTAYIGGMHDGGNIVATCITARLVRPRKAVCLSGLAGFAGAMLLGTGVARTVADSLVDTGQILGSGGESACLFVIAVFLGSILWNLTMWFIRLPSSSSHSLLGSLVGTSICLFGTGAVYWQGFLLRVICPMLLSPVIGFTAGFLLLKLEKSLLRDATMVWSGRIKVLDITATLLLAMAYGSNDSQKVAGIALIGAAAMAGGTTQTMPFWLMILCSAALAAGTMTGGFNMIRTVGRGIVEMNMDRSFSAQLSTMLVLETANLTGLPVSTTQVLTGSVMGAGAEDRPRSVNWGIVKNILTAWILTFPAAGAAGFLICRLLFVIVPVL